MRIHFILYVKNLEQSKTFYSAVLSMAPSLNVPGMTEFSLAGNTIIGLMPEVGAMRLFGASAGRAPDPQPALRAEVYLVVEDPALYHSRAIAAGAREISPLQDRDWGHRAAYSLDPDGYVLAFAEEIK